MKQEPWAQDCVAAHRAIDPRKQLARSPRRSSNGARKFPPKSKKPSQTAQREEAPVGQRRRLVRGFDARTGRPNSMSVTYLEAIREAQAHLLREDERVFIYGQDIAREIWRRVQGHERSGGRISRTRPEHADQRRRDGRDGDRRGHGRNAADCRDAVRGFLQHRAQSDSEQRRHAVLAHEYSLPDHGATALRRNERQRAVSQPEHGSDLLALSRGWSSSRRPRWKTPTRC